MSLLITFILAGFACKASKTHVVKITDSLFSLSQRYAVSQFELARLNQLSEPYALTVGQVLLLPETLDLSVLQIDGLALIK